MALRVSSKNARKEAQEFKEDQKGEEQEPAEIALSNGPDPEAIRQAADDILALHAKLEKVSSALRADIGHRYKKAAEQDGIDKKALKLYVGRKRQNAKFREKVQGLEEIEKKAFRSIEDALGPFADSPLGRAAAEAEAKAGDDAPAEPAEGGSDAEPAPAEPGPEAETAAAPDPKAGKKGQMHGLRRVAPAGNA